MGTSKTPVLPQPPAAPKLRSATSAMSAAAIRGRREGAALRETFPPPLIERASSAEDSLISQPGFCEFANRNSSRVSFERIPEHAPDNDEHTSGAGGRFRNRTLVPAGRRFD